MLIESRCQGGAKLVSGGGTSSGRHHAYDTRVRLTRPPFGLGENQFLVWWRTADAVEKRLRKRAVFAKLGFFANSTCAHPTTAVWVREPALCVAASCCGLSADGIADNSLFGAGEGWTTGASRTSRPFASSTA